MLAIHFTERDLRRITIADTPQVMEEIMLGVRALHLGRHHPATDQRRTTMTGRGRLSSAVLPLFDVARSARYIPDFLFSESNDIDSAIEAIAETPVPVLQTQLRLLGPTEYARHRVMGLAEGSTKARRDLAEAIRHYQRVAIAPYWQSIVASVAADRVARGRVLLDAGIDALLSTLHPTLRWRPPLLIKTGTPCGDSRLDRLAPAMSTVTRCLDGRGLTLVPCVSTATVAFSDVAGPTPVLAYPASAGLPRRAGSALATLLGATRSAVLASLADPATTTQTARRVHISVPSASQHAAVLRNAGLVSSSRQGPVVLHSLTPLGEQLLSLS